MIIFILFLLSAKSYAVKFGQYECGSHGRFEYCIDGIPGCVVGCHCFPGYYFDTDTKICEPHTKLTKAFARRLAPAEFSYGGSFAQIESAPPATAREPPQNAGDDDLSDWLYNQFFKTIENQIVNNNKTDDDEILKGTRRSGGPLAPMPTRRSKVKKYKKSHKHTSKHDLRKKLLRISEDDSLFDSSSSAEDSSSSSSSSSDESKSNSLGSWERFEWGAPSEQPSIPNRPESGKEPAAHRQIVVYSKKPKPQLPSFIFLPNMQPYYTPLGLPAPPVMPMYPMVPVPPISCPEGHADCVEKDATTTSEANSETSQTTLTTTTAMTTTTSAPVTQTESIPPNDPVSKDPLRSNNPFYSRPSDRKKPHPAFKPPAPHLPNASLRDYPIKRYPDSDYDSMFLGDNNLPLYGQDMKSYNTDDNPNFKYISDLIHKDYNGTTTQPTWKVSKPSNFKKPMLAKKRYKVKPGRLEEMTRRRFNPSKNEQDDSYYSTLGRQIATLIREIEAKGIRDADIKIEAQEASNTSHPFFSENSFMARSYWERFVRSPLDLKLKDFTRNYDFIGSNEQLFHLENKVQEATSAPALSWVELENIINTMGTVRKQMHENILRLNYTQPSNNSFNVSLLPRHTSAKVEQHERPPLRTNIKSNTPIAGRVFDEFVKDKIRNTMKPDSRPTKGERVSLNNTSKLKITHSNNKNSRVVNNSHGLKNRTRKHGRQLTARRFLSTVSQKAFLFNNTKYEIVPSSVSYRQNKNVNNDKNIKSPRIAVVGETNFFRAKKYFVDSNTNYQNNWSVE